MDVRKRHLTPSRMHRPRESFDRIYLECVFYDLLAERKLTVVNTHLQLLEEERRIATHALIQDFATSEMPLVIAGDFNTIDATGQQQMQLMEAHFRDVIHPLKDARSGKELNGTFMSFSIDKHVTHIDNPSPLDHIYINGLLSPTSLHAFAHLWAPLDEEHRDDQASDHMCVSVDLDYAHLASIHSSTPNNPSFGESTCVHE